MYDYNPEFVWKVFTALNPKDVECECSRIFEGGWTIINFTAANDLFYILAKRRKTDDQVYAANSNNPSGEMWLTQEAVGNA